MLSPKILTLAPNQNLYRNLKNLGYLNFSATTPKGIGQPVISNHNFDKALNENLHRTNYWTFIMAITRLYVDMLTYHYFINMSTWVSKHVTKLYNKDVTIEACPATYLHYAEY